MPKRPKEGSRAHQIWAFIRDNWNEGGADNTYNGMLMYRKLAKRADIDIEDIEDDVRCCENLWLAARDHLTRGAANPLAIYRCGWCGDMIPFQDLKGKAVNSPYCVDSDCKKYAHRSNAMPISRIEATYKIIAQLHKCLGCGASMVPTHFVCGHIKRRESDADDYYNNIHMICSPCNVTHGGRNMDEWIDEGSPGVLRMFEDTPKEVSDRNMLRYCEALYLDVRCARILDGTIDTSDSEAFCAKWLLSWINRQRG